MRSTHRQRGGLPIQGDSKMTFYAVYNSQGQFFARFTTFRRASLWTIRNGMEWTAIIKKEMDIRK
jgi:hypothetical protein